MVYLCFIHFYFSFILCGQLKAYSWAIRRHTHTEESLQKNCQLLLCVYVADKIDMTSLEIVLFILAVLLFLLHIVSLAIFIYWNVSKCNARAHSSHWSSLQLDARCSDTTILWHGFRVLNDLGVVLRLFASAVWPGQLHVHKGPGVHGDSERQEVWTLRRIFEYQYGDKSYCSYV